MDGIDGGAVDADERRPIAQGNPRLSASTLGGAVYAGAVGTIVPHPNEIALLVALALAVAPAVLVAATNPRFSAAPFSAVMVFFGPTITHAGPIASAVERVTEVAVGAIVGLIVSLVVLPGRARSSPSMRQGVCSRSWRGHCRSCAQD